MARIYAPAAEARRLDSRNPERALECIDEG
jgi:hypothetical protein